MTQPSTRGFLATLLAQPPARKLLPLEPPEAESAPAVRAEPGFSADADPRPAAVGAPWDQVRVAKGVERRLTPDQAPELHAIYAQLSARREWLVAERDRLERALTVTRRELDALSPAYVSMSACITQDGTAPDLVLENPADHEPGNDLSAGTVTPT